jgi:hypothetical protein
MKQILIRVSIKEDEHLKKYCELTERTLAWCSFSVDTLFVNQRGIEPRRLTAYPSHASLRVSVGLPAKKAKELAKANEKTNNFLKF